MNRFDELPTELQDAIYLMNALPEHKEKMKGVFEVFDNMGKWEDYVEEEMEISERTLEECYTDFWWEHGGYTYGEWLFINLHESGVVMDCYDSPQ